MLIRFAVENYRSFKEQQVFSMAAGRYSRHKEQVTNFEKKRILKGGMIFGANAAGKSNLISAMNYAKKIVIEGSSAASIRNRCFRIDSEYRDKPGIFQFDFIKNGHIYSYGFAISYIDGSIKNEWLYLCDNVEKCIFERDANGFRHDVEFKIKDNKKRFSIYSEDVSDNRTFLSEIVSHKLENEKDFQPYFDTYRWIVSLIIIFPQTRFGSIRQYLMDEAQSSFGEMMESFDTGIHSIHGEDRKLEDVLNFLPPDAQKEVSNGIIGAFESKENGIKPTSSVEAAFAGKRFSFKKNPEGDIVAKQLVMDHGNPDDLFDLEDESDGTRRLFDLLPVFTKAKNNYVVIIDELDRSFHTKLTLEFIKRFFMETSGKNCQLIVTLHDLNVMDLDLVRQDEIWFVEREANQSSILYSLDKFKARFDDKSLVKDYLKGRYGAVPKFL